MSLISEIIVEYTVFSMSPCEIAVMNHNQSSVHSICKNLCLEKLPGYRNETIIASFQ